MILTKFLNSSNKKVLKNVQTYYDVFGTTWGDYIPISSAFVKESWDKLARSGKGGNPNTNGAIFEYLIYLCLDYNNILPFYIQATVACVPNAKYDIVLYTEENLLITLSIKSSLRERYKQADLEGWALRNVHRKALNYLITLDEKAAKGVLKKINNNHITGLDKIFVASAVEFDELIKSLSSYNFCSSKKFDVIETGKLIQK